LKRNKMTPKRARDLVIVHNNFCLLFINSSKYKKKKIKLWDIEGDDFSFDENGILEINCLSLNGLEFVFFSEDEQR